LFIKQRLGLTDEETVEKIRENAYVQFLLGFAGYSSKAPFDSSMMVHCRKRFSEEQLSWINELIAERGKTQGPLGVWGKPPKRPRFSLLRADHAPIGVVFSLSSVQGGRFQAFYPVGAP
jgi:hypothetical protein